MKIKNGFMLREIAGSWVVVPIGERVVEFNGLIALSESGAMLWKRMEDGAEEEDLIQVILNEYEIDEATARMDVQAFITATRERGLIE